MTVALGILAGNCQIIAADTQLSSDSEKLGSGKIHTHVLMPSSERPYGAAISVTGAGDSFNLQALQMELGEVFSQKADDPLDAFYAAARKHVKDFYRDYVAIAPDVSQRPEVDLIITARCGNDVRMWIARRAKMMKANSPIAVGIGAMYAQGLLDALDIPHDANTAMLLAAYVVFLVERRNVWVGMDTNVVCLAEGNNFPLRGFTASACRKLNEMFRQCLSIETRVIHRMLGSAYDFCEAGQIMRDIETMRGRFLEIFNPVNSREVEQGHPSSTADSLPPRTSQE